MNGVNSRRRFEQEATEATEGMSGSPLSPRSPVGSGTEGNEGNKGRRRSSSSSFPSVQIPGCDRPGVSNQPRDRTGFPQRFPVLMQRGSFILLIRLFLRGTIVIFRAAVD